MSDSQPTAIEKQTIFLCAERSFTGRDVLDAALFRGELEPEWKNLQRLIAAEHRGEEESVELDENAIDIAAEQFRYEHNLITAEETEQWLAEHGVSLGDFTNYFIRHYWGNQWEDVETTYIPYSDASPGMRKLLSDEVLLSGRLDRMALRSSWRMAAYSARAPTVADPQLMTQERAAFLQRHEIDEESLPGWLDAVGRDPQWLREMLELEATYRCQAEALLSREAREHEIAALRLPLTRFEVETIELDSLDAAREALLCAREDGMSMEEVAAEGRYPYRHPEVLLEQVPEDLQQKFLSMHPGEILEPIARGEGFHLCRILGKEEPDLSDPLVQERADERILDRHFSNLMTRFIQWRLFLT